MTTAVELRGARASALASARAIFDRAQGENRDMTSEEHVTFTNAMADADTIGAKVRTAEDRERLEANEAEMRASTGRRIAPASVVNTFTRDALDPHTANEFMRSWAMAGAPGHRPTAEAQHRAAQYGFDVAAQVMTYRTPPQLVQERALSKGTTTAGGFTVPQSFSTELEKVLGYFFPIADAFDVFGTEDGQDYPWPTVTDVANSSAIVAEAGAIGSSTDPTFAQIVYKSWDYFSPIVKVSYQLLRDSARNIPQLLAELFGERMGRAMDAATVSANAGSAAPEGILNGVSAGVNLATGNAITYAKLLALETSVDIAYRNLPGTGFVMHDATWQAIRAIVDSTGRPMVMSNIQEGSQKRLLGYPVFISNNMTSIASPTDNSVHILFGALKKYKVRRVGGSTLTRLNELYAGNGQVGFCLHEAWDGRWVTKVGVKTLNAEDTA